MMLSQVWNPRQWRSLQIQLFHILYVVIDYAVKIQFKFGVTKDPDQFIEHEMPILVRWNS